MEQSKIIDTLETYHAASEPAHILDPLGRLNLLNSLDLVWVCLDPAL